MGTVAVFSEWRHFLLAKNILESGKTEGGVAGSVAVSLRGRRTWVDWRPALCVSDSAVDPSAWEARRGWEAPGSRGVGSRDSQAAPH